MAILGIADPGGNLVLSGRGDTVPRSSRDRRTGAHHAMADIGPLGSQSRRYSWVGLDPVRRSGDVASVLLAYRPRHSPPIRFLLPARPPHEVDHHRHNGAICWGKKVESSPMVNPSSARSSGARAPFDPRWATLQPRSGTLTTRVDNGNLPRSVATGHLVTSRQPRARSPIALR